jgi:hypothetical protein
MSEPLASVPSSPVEAEIHSKRKTVALLTIVYFQPVLAGQPMPGQILYDALATLLKPPLAVEDERSFGLLMSDLVAGELVVEHSGRTRVAAVAELSFSLAPFMLEVIEAIRKSRTVPGPLDPTVTPPQRREGSNGC